MDRLERLRLFCRIVETGSVTAAARELGFTQSTASKALAALEAELAVPLLERTTRALRVTFEGRRLHERARTLLADFDEVLAPVASATAPLEGDLRISVPVVFGRRYVVPVVAELARAHPGLRFRIEFADRYVSPVEDGYDVVVRVGVAVDSTSRARRIASTPRYLVAAPAYLAARGRPVRPAELARHDCLVHAAPRGESLWRFTRAGVTTRARVRGPIAADNSEAVLDLARGGLGIALLASWILKEDLRAGRLVRLLPTYEAPPAPVQALLGPARHVPPRVRVFVDALTRSVPRLLRA